MSSDAPLAMTLSPTSWCRLVGTHTLTASRPCRNKSSRLVNVATPKRAATSSRVAWSVSTTPMTLTPCISL